MAMGGGLGSLAPYQQAITQPTVGKGGATYPQPTQGKGVPLSQTQPKPPYVNTPFNQERPPNPFADQFSEQDKDNYLGFYDQNGPAYFGPDNSAPLLGREQKSDLNMIREGMDGLLTPTPAVEPRKGSKLYDAIYNSFTPLTFGDQFTDFMNSPEYKRAVETDRERGGMQTADMSRSDIFPDYMGSSSAIAPYERAYRDYEARINAPTSGLDMGPGNTDFFRNAPRTDLPFTPARPGTPDYTNALTLDPNYGRRPQIPRYPFIAPQPFYGGLGGFLGGGYGFPMGPMYGGFRNRFGGFPMGMMPYQQPFYQQPVMGKGFSPFRPIQPQTQPTMGKGPSDQPVVPSQEEMTPLLDEFTDFYLNEFRPKYNAPATASPYGSTLANQNLFGIGRLLSGMR